MALHAATSPAVATRHLPSAAAMHSSMRVSHHMQPAPHAAIQAAAHAVTQPSPHRIPRPPSALSSSWSHQLPAHVQHQHQQYSQAVSVPPGVHSVQHSQYLSMPEGMSALRHSQQQTDKHGQLASAPCDSADTLQQGQDRVPSMQQASLAAGDTLQHVSGAASLQSASMAEQQLAAARPASELPGHSDSTEPRIPYVRLCGDNLHAARQSWAAQQPQNQHEGPWQHQQRPGTAQSTASHQSETRNGNDIMTTASSGIQQTSSQQRVDKDWQFKTSPVQQPAQQPVDWETQCTASLESRYKHQDGMQDTCSDSRKQCSTQDTSCAGGASREQQRQQQTYGTADVAAAAGFATAGSSDTTALQQEVAELRQQVCWLHVATPCSPCLVIVA